MSIATLVVFCTLAGLVAAYMLRPRWRQLRVSMARFLIGLESRESRSLRFVPKAPLTSWSFWRQFLVLVSLLLAVGSLPVPVRLSTVGLWLVLDTSHSLSMRLDGEAAIDRLRREAVDVVERAVRAAGDAGLCIRISSFDVSVRHLWSGSDPAAAADQIDALEPLPRGTDLAVVQSLFDSQPDVDSCAINTIVVVSDLPAPEIRNAGERVLIWRDVGEPTDNVGIVGIDIVRNAATFRVEQIQVLAKSWLGGRPEIALEVLGAVGDEPELAVKAGPWRPDNVRVFTVDAPRAGTYRLELTSPDSLNAYLGDDHAAVDVPQYSGISVDWRVSDDGLVRLLGWERATADATFVVADRLPALAEKPGILVGSGFRDHPMSPVRFFSPHHPLLDGINLDVVEGIAPAAGELPEGFSKVLEGRSGTWVAARSEPRAVLLPGLPKLDETQPEVLSNRLFFNAVRWLLEGHGEAPSVTLMSEDGEVIEAGFDEGRTDRPAQNYGSLEDIGRAGLAPADTPRWYWFVAAAMLLLIVERLLSARGDSRWT